MAEIKTKINVTETMRCLEKGDEVIIPLVEVRYSAVRAAKDRIEADSPIRFIVTEKGMRGECLVKRVS